MAAIWWCLKLRLLIRVNSSKVLTLFILFVILICITYWDSTMKIGKIEKAILKALEKPYPKHGIDGYSYPLYGSDTKQLVRVIYGDDGLEQNRYLGGKPQATLSRALNSLHRKGLVARLKPERDYTERRFISYLVDERLRNPEARYATEYPRSTKVWWVLPKHLQRTVKP